MSNSSQHYKFPLALVLSMLGHMGVMRDKSIDISSNLHPSPQLRPSGPLLAPIVLGTLCFGPCALPSQVFCAGLGVHLGNS